MRCVCDSLGFIFLVSFSHACAQKPSPPEFPHPSCSQYTYAAPPSGLVVLLVTVHTTSPSLSGSVRKQLFWLLREVWCAVRSGCENFFLYTCRRLIFPGVGCRLSCLPCRRVWALPAGTLPSPLYILGGSGSHSRDGQWSKRWQLARSLACPGHWENRRWSAPTARSLPRAAI